jgi:DNA-binding PadR family transcriptional regulator
MAGPQSAAEPARFALLGLLVAGPRHGYHLARSFAAGSALNEIVHLSLSHLYALLGRLERDGLVRGHREESESGAYPPRRVYELTESGRAAVLRWIDQPVEHPREMRIDFPLKLYIARQLDPERAQALVERQRALFSSYVDRLQREPPPKYEGEDSQFITLLREGRIGRLRAALSWLDYCRETQYSAVGQHPRDGGFEKRS